MQIIWYLAAVLLFSFSSKAYCWSLNDIQNTVKQAASQVTSNSPTGASNNNTQQQAAQPSQPGQNAGASLNPIESLKGPYGLPLGGDLDAFWQWL